MEITLLDPWGNPLPVLGVTVSQAVNQGWTWSATLASVPHDYTVDGESGHSLLDACLEDATFTLTLEANGETLVLPPLVVTDYQEDVAGGGTLSGIDMVMYRLTRSTHVLGWEQGGSTSGAVLAWIFAQSGLTGSVTGVDMVDFPILQQDNGVRTNLLAPLVRILDIAGYEFRVTSGATPSGAVLAFYPLEIDPDGSAGPQPDWSLVTRQRSFSQRITRLLFLKTSKTGSGNNFQFTAPNQVADLSMAGAPFHSVQASQWNAQFYAGHPDSGGVLVGTGHAYGGVDATHIKSASAGQIQVTGTRSVNVPEGIDLAFEHLHESGISPPRPADDPWEDSWFPSLAHVQYWAQAYLWARNRATHTMSYQGPPCLWLGLGYRLTWPGHPDSRAESITHTLGPGQASTSVETAVLGPNQW